MGLTKEFKAGNLEQCLRQHLVIPNQGRGLTTCGQPPQNEKEISPHGIPHPGKQKSV